jgi:glutamate formiminotransferase
VAIVECVPNFSEGRRQPVIDALAATVRGVPAVRLLDVQSDPDHNRSVLTFLGEPEDVLWAAMAAIRKATELIDMEQHSGSHPRLGATDVVPFVPVSGATLELCVGLARRLGERVAAELGVPVYLYGAAATRPERTLVADIRRGQYEGLKQEISLPERLPDFGAPTLHPTAGAIVIGARPPMVAYNVYLSSADLALAKSIAKRVRERSGGLPRVQAIGLEVKGGETQVSMNLLDTTKTSIWQAFAEVRRLAEAAGARVTRSEVVGLVTMDALVGSFAQAICCPELGVAQVIESHLVGGAGGPAQPEQAGQPERAGQTERAGQSEQAGQPEHPAPGPR